MLDLRKMYKEMHVTDRRILITSALLMLLFAYLVVDDRLLNFGHSSKSPVIGEIVIAREDVRHKQSNNLNWEAARESDDLRIGDSIFTGKSSNALVKIQSSTIEVGENSLISFKKVKGLNVSNLNLGEFSIKVNGSLKVEVNGEMVELKGRNSTLKATLDTSKKVTWRAVKGNTVVSSPKGTTQINALNPAQTEAVVSVFPPAPIRSLEEPSYYLHVEEFYTTHEDKYRLRTDLPVWYNTPIHLAWKDHNEHAVYTVQLASDSQFSENVQIIDTEEKRHTFPRIKRGENFWRVSRSGNRSDWSSPQSIDFEPTLKTEGPMITSGSPTLQIISKDVDFQLTWQKAPDSTSYFIEASRDPHFSPEKTSIARTEQLTHSVRFHEPGTFYFRVRSMNASRELTVADQTVINVIEIPLLGSPEVPKRDLVFKNSKAPVLLPWKGPKGAVAYDVELRDLRDQKSIVQKVEGTKLEVAQLKNGPYTYQVTPRDQFGRKGRSSVVKSFVVSVPAEIKLAKREPAQNIVAKTEPPPPPVFMNDSYPNSTLQVEGAGFTMYSSSQVYNKESAPLAATMGIRVLQWMKNLGWEGLLKTKVFNYNKSGSEVDPLWAEARVHNRWTFPFHWLETFREVQVSLFLGAEQYNNFGSDQFSRRYTLMKAGTLVAFPVMHRFDTGGELVYGRGLDSSYKYEVAGYLNYYLKKQWTYGVGYRVHLFNAGSLKSAPRMPFREGYSEIYSALRYLY